MRKVGRVYLDKELDIDHCHETGIIRSLLCNRCNQALGLFKDDIESLKKAINYLERLKCIL